MSVNNNPIGTDHLDQLGRVLQDEGARKLENYYLRMKADDKGNITFKLEKKKFYSPLVHFILRRSAQYDLTKIFPKLSQTFRDLPMSKRDNYDTLQTNLDKFRNTQKGKVTEHDYSFEPTRSHNIAKQIMHDTFKTNSISDSDVFNLTLECLERLVEHACTNGKIELLEQLMKHSDFDIDMRCGDPQIGFDNAPNEMLAPTLLTEQALLKKYDKSKSEQTYSSNPTYKTHLNFYVESGQLESHENAYKGFINNAKEKIKLSRKTPLMIAIEKKNIAVVKKLLERKSPNLKLVYDSGNKLPSDMSNNDGGLITKETLEMIIKKSPSSEIKSLFRFN